MRKIISLMIFTCFCSFFSMSQIKFFKVFADNGYDFGQGIVELADSSYIVTGSSSSFLDAPSQAYMLKIDKNGNHLWAKHFGGSEADLGRRILNWNDSVFFIAGYSNSFSAGDFDFHLWKVNKNGEFISENSYGNSGWEKMNDALITLDSSIVMVGQTSSTSNSNGNFYIVKTDHNGDTLWTRNFGSIGEDVLNSVKQLNDTTFYAVGSQYNVDSTLTKGAVVRFYSNGVIDWVKEYGNYGAYELNDFYFIYNMMYCAGSRIHPIDGDKDEYILRMENNGVLEGEEVPHAEGDKVVKGVAKYGSAGMAYVAAEFKDQFSAGYSTDVIYNRYFESLYWDNNFVVVPFPLEETHGELIKTKDGGAIATGSFASGDFGGSAVYVIKIGPNDNYPVVNLSNTESLVFLNETEMDNNFSVYPNPTANQFTVSVAEKVTVRIVDVNGRELSTEIVEQTKEYNVSKWNAGIYFVTVEKENGAKSTKKLIVQ